MRWVDLDGVHNMRDVGGLPTRDGRVTRSGRLLRSDNLQSLTPRDVERLTGELGVTDIVDLRSDVEIRLEGPGPLVRVTSLTHHHHSLLKDESARRGAGPQAIRRALSLPWAKSRAARAARAAHAAGAAGAGRATRAARAARQDEEFWGQHYLGYLSGRPDSVSAALRVVATSSGAVVVHCAAGKDRTGTVVALALAVADVPRDEIVADYLATGERLDAVLAQLSRRPAYARQLRHQRAQEQLPRGPSMEHLLRTLELEYGGARGWLTSHGWSEADVAALRAKLVD